MVQVSDGGGGYAGGPSEQELIKTFGFATEQVRTSATEWHKASEGVLQVSKDVEQAMNDLDEHWSGSASAAAQGALKELKASLAAHAENLGNVHSGLKAAATAADAAQDAWGKLPSISVDASTYDKPVQGPTPDGQPLTKFDSAGYDAAVAAKKQAREQAATESLQTFTSSMNAAKKDLGYAPLDANDNGPSGPTGPSSPTSSGGGGGTPPSGGGGGGSHGFSGANTGTAYVGSTTGWNSTGTGANLGQYVTDFGPGLTGGPDYVTSVDGNVTGSVPEGPGMTNLPPTGSTGGVSGLAGAAGVGGVVAGGVGAGAMIRGAGGGGGGLFGGGGGGMTAAGGRPGAAGLGGSAGGTTGSAGGAGAAGTGGRGLAGSGGTSAVAAGSGGRGGMGAGGGAGGAGGSSGVKGASAGGKYGVPKLGEAGGAGGRGGSSTTAVGQGGAGGAKGAGSRTGAGAAGGAGGGRGGDDKDREGQDRLTHEDEENWYDDSDASPAVWQD